MDTIFVVRCGTCHRKTFRLDPAGVEQMNRLAKRLAPLVAGKSVLLLASPALGATESAQILADKLAVEVQAEEILYSDDSIIPDLAETSQLIRTHKNNAEVIVLVTHPEHCRAFPTYFANHVLQAELPRLEVGPGNAFVIDCKTKAGNLLITQ